jgi:hypothetical protein
LVWGDLEREKSDNKNDLDPIPSSGEPSQSASQPKEQFKKDDDFVMSYNETSFGSVSLALQLQMSTLLCT